ncbi:hypothetical protein F6R98_06400 [Candidatus Methylospira mobilis]|uniref:Uncharacterized protein n=1 Tax=Candidatus Methylospira mobilis TaxID=1808979 RepID=A0A5Q0BJB3_9GAMM|nr:hypothetical protein [Candidatus Methylospira mobilis]QFY42301.1 hypothetical protein F6R98_06400 [Candidatus Methylospira mobilis]
MSDYQGWLSSLAQEAKSIKVGNIKLPDELLNTLEQTSVLCLNNHATHESFNILQANYSFIEIRKDSSLLISDEQKYQSITLLAWLIHSIDKWRKNLDSERRMLLGLFIVSCFLDDRDGGLWKVLPCYTTINTELLDELQLITSNLASNVSTIGEPPIWERESVEQFQVAINNRDWLTISNLWNRLKQASLPLFFQTQIIRLLAHYDSSRLRNAFINSKDIPILMHSIDALTVEQALTLGAYSDNPYVEFSAVHGALSKIGASRDFIQNEQSMLVMVLNKVSRDVLRFNNWMDVFNAYPLRYPALQTALGLFLAQSEGGSIFDAYINSIALSKLGLDFQSNKSRALVAKCLGIFCKSADIEKRKNLWRKAYERWSEWNFEVNTMDSHIFSVVVSDLDFALIGYYLECMTHNDRIAYKTDVLQKLRVSFYQWYRSTSDLITCVNRLISHMQPVAHAIIIQHNSSELWLMDGKYDIPEQFKDNAYIKMMLEV